MEKIYLNAVGQSYYSTTNNFRQTLFLQQRNLYLLQLTSFSSHCYQHEF